MKAYGLSVITLLALLAAGVVVAGQEAGPPAGIEEIEMATEAVMDDAQARGYQAATENDTEAAAGWFKKAADYADGIASWEGLMDASLALSSIGEVDASKAVLDRANTLSAKFKDWRTSLAMGHAYASLPDEAEADDEAQEAIDFAKQQAEKLKSWRAMVEVGTAYMGLKLDEAKEYATDAYDTALTLASEAKDPEGVEELAMRFEEIGDEVKAAEARELVKQLPPKPEPNKKRHRPPPPPGWSPTGKSLAEPREISEESKAILAERAARKHADATALALKKGHVDDQDVYIYEYSRYWASHPLLFRHRIWDSGPDFDTTGWAKHHLSQYRLVGGTYVRIGTE